MWNNFQKAIGPVLGGAMFALSACLGAPTSADRVPQAVTTVHAALPAITGLRVTRSGAGFLWISWSPALSSGFTGAVIYRSTANDFSTATRIARTSLPTYFDHDVQPGTAYYYWIRYESGGETGPLSTVSYQPDTPTPSPTTPPGNMPQLVGTPPPYVVAPASLKASEEPIVVNADRVHVGANVEADTAGLTRRTFADGLTVYTGTVSDGVTGRVLNNYLARDAQDSGVTRLLRFRKPPTVSVVDGATPDLIRETAHAVQIINASLPPDWQLVFDVRPTRSPDGQPENGRIVVEFEPATARFPRPGSDTLGDGRKWFYENTGTVISGTVWVDPERSSGGVRVGVLVHEILHALGRGHVPGVQSLMRPTAAGVPGHILHDLDRDALYAVHGFIEGAGAGDTATQLGPWSASADVLAGEFDDAEIRFGVSTRNGFSQPWASGPAPLYPLADNPELSGSASWSGRFLGHTPDGARDVAGDMGLQIYLARMTGTLTFDDLEQWATYGVGAGRRWADGELAYGVRVTGNYLVRTGGDDGLLTGAFFGDHDGVGGTLRRSDLVGAFGGTLD